MTTQDNKPSKKVSAYTLHVRNFKHLHPFFQDFHTQKSIFRYLYHVWDLNDSNNKKLLVNGNTSWRTLHIAMIDGLLYTLGVCGYKLGNVNSKNNFSFLNLTDAMDSLERHERNLFLLGDKKVESEEHKSQIEKSLSELNTPIVVNEDLKKWVDSLNHLPKILKREESQKALVDAVVFVMSKNKHEYSNINKHDLYILIFDIFLKYIAYHGFIVKKSRAKVDFINLEASLSYFEKERN